MNCSGAPGNAECTRFFDAAHQGKNQLVREKKFTMIIIVINFDWPNEGRENACTRAPRMDEFIFEKYNRHVCRSANTFTHVICGISSISGPTRKKFSRNVCWLLAIKWFNSGSRVCLQTRLFPFYSQSCEVFLCDSVSPWIDQNVFAFFSLTAYIWVVYLR